MALKIRADGKVGACTGFYYDVFNRLHGISAAHVLVGVDRRLINYNNQFDSLVQCFINNQYWPSARSKSIFWEAPNLPGDFGRIDMGTFLFNAVSKAAIQPRLAPLTVNPHLINGPHGFIGVQLNMTTVVTGVNIVGQVVDAENEEYDFIIKFPDAGPFTRNGDSGSMWYDNMGNAVAMHIRSLQVGTSIYSLSTSIYRVTRLLGINNFFRLS